MIYLTCFAFFNAKKYYEPFLPGGKKILLLGMGFVEKTIGYQVGISIATEKFLSLTLRNNEKG